ncbi:NTP-binding protein [Corynebacterium diphtheriae]|nr:NTP-binding protein [Corynebacterium diphtheriae]
MTTITIPDTSPYPPPGQPFATARRLMADLFSDGEDYTLVSWRGDFWRFNGAHWEMVGDELEIKAPLWEKLDQATYVTADHEVKPWNPTKSKVAGLLEPMAVANYIPAVCDAPVWDDGRSGRGIIAMDNGLFNLATRRLDPHTPRLFSTWGLSFDYDDTAQCPTWLSFLESIFSHDPKAVDALQEYMGYLISGETNQHKALMMIGAPRAGKSTISTVVQALMGYANVATTSLHDLGSEFGLGALVGKPLTVIEDARDGGPVGRGVVERLLSIVANDSMSVNRKNLDYWNGRLNTRLIVASNEVPRLPDASGAILNRFITIRFVRSFSEDEQDKQLKGRLLKELPGIFNWALAGLDRLHAQGRFTAPESSGELEATFSELAEPLQVFMDECDAFEITGDHGDCMDASTMLGLYRAWTNLEGRQRLNRESLASKITAMYPTVKYVNAQRNDAGEYDPTAKKRRMYLGVKPINNPHRWMVSGAA